MPSTKLKYLCNKKINNQTSTDKFAATNIDRKNTQATPLSYYWHRVKVVLDLPSKFDERLRDGFWPKSRDAPSFEDEFTKTMMSARKTMKIRTLLGTLKIV